MLSIPHLIIIFLVALVVFGPEKLPELARNFGKIMAEFRRATGDLRSTFEEHMRDLEREADDRRIGSGRSQTPPPSRATGESGDSAPANAVPTTPLSSRVPPDFSKTRGDGPSDDSNASASDAHESSGSGELARDAAPPTSDSVPDPAASLATSRSSRGANAADSEAENKTEIVSDGHSPS